MFLMVDDFVEWVKEEMRNRSLKQTDVAVRGGITRSAVSKLLSRSQTKPGNKMIRAIATAFRLPISEVYSRAGLIPPKREHHPLVDEYEELLGFMTEEERVQSIRFARLLAEGGMRQNEERQKAQRSTRRVGTT